MKACQGGWCRRRENCQHYNAPDRRYPADRLCEKGRDGVLRMSKPVPLSAITETVIRVIEQKEAA